MATDEQVATAFIAQLAALGAIPYDYDDLAKVSPKPTNYTEVTVTRRFGGEQRASGERDGRLYRATARQVSQTVSNARNLRAKSAGLEGLMLTVAGSMTTPIEFETADVIAPDDGWFSGLETWTFALI
jgi:hypothetical protein